MSTSLDLFALLVLLGSVSVCLSDGTEQSLPKRLPFVCLGTTVCNRDSWQYCDEAAYKRCRHCSDVKRYCWTQQMPHNCSIYCLEQNQEQQRVKDCPPLNSTSHGHHNGSTGARHGDEIVVKCDGGYHHVGSASIECTDYGHYSGTFLCIEENPNLQTEEKSFVRELVIVSVICGCGWFLFIATVLYVWYQKQKDENRLPETKPLVDKEPDSEVSVNMEPIHTNTDEGSRAQSIRGSRSIMRQRSRSETDPSTLDRHAESLNGDPRSTSIPDISPRGAAGGPSGPINMPASEDSKDSGINIDLLQGGKGTTINIYNNVSASSKAENVRNGSDISTKENIDLPPKVQSKVPPKEPIDVKLSTEETGSTSKSCRAELGADPEMSDVEIGEDIATERKILDDRKSSSDLFIKAVEEQEKDPLTPKVHVQPLVEEKNGDKFAIGNHDVGKSDVLF